MSLGSERNVRNVITACERQVPKATYTIGRPVGQLGQVGTISVKRYSVRVCLR